MGFSGTAECGDCPLSIYVKSGVPLQSPNAALKYRADIDGMRAVAVILVLLFHFALLPAVKAGFLGVDIFFVISGFLITTIVRRELDAGTFRFGNFYTNRIRRLAPALSVTLFTVLCAGVFWLFPDQLLELSKQVLASQLYVANFYYWRNFNYFGLGVHDVFLLHTWSLAVEEQFYLIYPAFLLLSYRYCRKHLLAVVISGLVISFGLNILFVADKPEATFYLLPTRAWQLLAGAAVSMIVAGWKRSRYADELIGLTGLALVIASVTCYRADFHIPGFYALLPTAGSVCLLLSGQNHATFVSRGLSWPPIRYVGMISYPLYLVHWPINVFAGLLIRDYTTGWRITMFALSIAAAAILYHAVENPVRAKRVLASKKALLSSYAAGISASILAYLAVQMSAGLPQRFPAEVARLASFANDKTAPSTECEFLGLSVINPGMTCRIGAERTDPTWLVYGDSHAWAARAAFDKWLKLNGQAGFLVFRHNCPPLTGIHINEPRDECFVFNQAVERFIADHAALSHIALVSTWQWPVRGGLLNSSLTLLSTDESMRQYTSSFLHTIEHLHQLGRQVYVWEPVPGAQRSVPIELARALMAHRPPVIEIDRAEYFSVNRPFFDALAASREWIAGSFSPSQTLCSTGKCAVEYQGNPLYIDNAHVTKSSADFWVRILQNGAGGPEVH
jgi:peptidoglycan/LPS O-acetylase OafA/YrhL